MNVTTKVLGRQIEIRPTGIGFIKSLNTFAESSEVQMMPLRRTGDPAWCRAVPDGGYPHFSKIPIREATSRSGAGRCRAMRDRLGRRAARTGPRPARKMRVHFLLLASWSLRAPCSRP